MSCFGVPQSTSIQGDDLTDVKVRMILRNFTRGIAVGRISIYLSLDHRARGMRRFLERDELRVRHVFLNVVNDGEPWVSEIFFGGP